jgi:hypothetical protein
VAVLLGSAGTPAAVILAQAAPWPIDALLAWPLVLVDRLVEPALHARGSQDGPPQSTPAHVVAAVAGIALTWLFYVVLARVIIRRAIRR